MVSMVPPVSRHARNMRTSRCSSRHRATVTLTNTSTATMDSVAGTSLK
jgi:hypothetical protein